MVRAVVMMLLFIHEVQSMLASHYIKFSIGLLVASVSLEITLLAGLFQFSDALYHGIHLLLMVILIASQLTLFLTANKHLQTRKYALWFAIATTFTAIGDYVNSAVSAVQPVSMKLTWAMLLFGIGYAVYNFVLWQLNQSMLKQQKKTRFSGLQYAIALLILAINVVSWFQHVEPNIRGLDVLYYGSFIFNATIYVMMPLFAVWFLHQTKYSMGGLLVLLGAFLIPYSDLILFASWLRGNPPVPSFQLYAYNWILYFSGQALFTQLPSWAMMAESKTTMA
jgi:hypothetical protein